MSKPKFEIGDNLAFVLIILIIMIICLLGGYLESKAQTVLLPTWLADSMIYEVSKGRQCANVIEAQVNELEKQGQELIATGTALRLSQSESETLENLLTLEKSDRTLDAQQATLDKKLMKEKIKRLWVWVFSEAGAILILVILL